METTTTPYPHLVGRICFITEQNLAYDSYFHATYWTGEKFDTQQTATTAFPDCGNMIWNVRPGDTYHLPCTPGTPAYEHALNNAINRRRQDAETEAARVRKGSTVTINRGKHAGKIGIVGTVFADRYKSSRWATVYQAHVYTPSGDVLKYQAVVDMTVNNATIEFDEPYVRQSLAAAASTGGWWALLR
jgi:hypothetical protein